MKDQFSEDGLYISALQHVIKLILSSYVLLAYINTVISIKSRLIGFEVNIKQLCSSTIHKYIKIIDARHLSLESTMLPGCLRTVFNRIVFKII